MGGPEQSSIESAPSLVTLRRGLITEQQPSLKIGKEEGRGDSVVVYSIEDEGTASVLKVSKMEKGILPNEIHAFSNLSHIPGIPKLFEKYEHEGITIAIRVEKIIGQDLDSYLTNNKDIGEVLIKIHKLILAVHSLGSAMPRDWLKGANWKITDSGKPYLIDLGEPSTVFDPGPDLRNFHSLIERYESRLTKKEKKILDAIIYRDYMDRQNHIGGNPWDR